MTAERGAPASPAGEPASDRTPFAAGTEPVAEPVAAVVTETTVPPPGAGSRRSRRQAGGGRRRRAWIEWPLLIGAAVVAAILIRTFVLQTFWIPSGSMMNTLVRNDRVVVNKLSYKFHDIHRGDVVVFHKPPNLNVDDEDLIKRVVGVAGDTVEAHGGFVYRDGKKQTEKYVDKDCGSRPTSDFGPITVPKGDIWVMGDNRCNSSDSRVFGPIKTKLVIGHAFVLIWPISRWDWL